MAKVFYFSFHWVDGIGYVIDNLNVSTAHTKMLNGGVAIEKIENIGKTRRGYGLVKAVSASFARDYVKERLSLTTIQHLSELA